MTVSTSTNTVEYNGSIATSTALSVPFKFFKNSEIVVTKSDQSPAGANATTWVEGVDYTLTGADVDAGGTLTTITAVTSTEKLTFVRTVALTQDTDYVDGDAFPAKAHEDALDKLTMIVQQQSGGGVTINTAAISSAPEILGPPDTGKALVWDANGDLANSTSNFETAVAAAAASAAAASTSETNAATSETNAANSEANAATSETNAQTYANNAAASAASVDADVIDDLRITSLVQEMEIQELEASAVKNLPNAFSDVYTDETGIDTGASTFANYDATNDLYENPESVGDANVELYLPFDGADGATTFEDFSDNKHTITLNNSGAELDNAQSVFGGTSLLNINVNSYLSVAADAGFHPPQHTNWCWEGRIRFNAQDTGDQWIFIMNSGTGVNYLRYRGTDTNELAWNVDGTGGSAMAISATGLTLNTATWYHVACVKVGTDYGLYLDGIQVGYGTSTLNGGTPAELQISGTSSGSESFDGWNEEFIMRSSNFFSAAPVVGLTDTINVPTSALTTQGQNMSLESQSVTSLTADPTTVQVVAIIDETRGDTVTANTDLKLWASRDGGTTFTETTEELVASRTGSKKIFKGDADISAQPSGTAMRYKVTTLNNKLIRVLSGGMSWNA